MVDECGQEPSRHGTLDMDDERQRFCTRCLLVDIEVNEKGVVYAIGGVQGDRTFRSPSGKPVTREALTDLNRFAGEAEFLLGHNILSHDLPHLRAIAPELPLFAKSAIDTLYLSPLAFPANPYHRLVKNYQLVRDSLSDPVEDAKLAGQVFVEQWEAFGSQLSEHSDIPVIYHSFLHTDERLAGTASAFAAMGVPLLEGDDLYEAFGWFAKKHACRSAVDRLLDQLYDNDPSLPKPMLAYVAAWLSVAGGNSVLPPWVRHTFPLIASVLHGLRENGCEDSQCVYCHTHHNPRTFLNSFFGFPDFRPEPTTPEGKSLQGEVITASAQSGTIFATLPTGGGKSLCYLLPALMRYQRRNLLTIVISPLQALMKDQVDNFSKQTGTKLAAALYGMLTMPERGEVMEGVRLGDIGVLYVSPEQLRNRSFIETISQREIGAWVFDEAHCLSKWGHDFRPDYFYAIRFIREFAVKHGVQIPPVQCFTATAKKDVKAEIIDTVQSELGLKVLQFEGGHERTNLHYEAFSVTRHEKQQTILQLLKERFSGKGCVVIYCATQKNTEQLAEFLQRAGYAAEAFHAGLEAPLKKRLLEQFIAGEIPVICATNAFGMGIDKDDVRLVLHADIPGSLENYLQEAGRAGRDRKDAECILVFDEQDIEKQFKLSAMSRLTRREIAQLLRGIRSASRNNQEVVLTAGELLRRKEVDLDPDAINDGDTRVRTAIAWLERAGFLERNENNTRVFQGKVLVADLEEAARRIASLDLSERQSKRWLDILHAILNKEGSQTGFSADELAAITSFALSEEDPGYETETQRVLRTLHDMAEQGLLSKETTLSAYLRYKVGNHAGLHLQRTCALEREFLAVLRELAPDAELAEPLELDLRQFNQRLIDRSFPESTPHMLKLLLYGLTRDGKGLAGQSGSISLRARGNNSFVVYLQRGWESLAKTMEIRQQAASRALEAILAAIDPAEKANANLYVEFTLEQIVDGLKSDLLLFSQMKKPLAVAERALTFMHEQGVLDLQQGLAIFRQAMTLMLKAEAEGRRYAVSDFEPLKTHYTERNFQIHVMNEYAQKALEKISTAMRLVASYFNDDKEDFVQRYFPGRKKVLDRATSEQSYTRIVDDLKNKAQAAIVSASPEKNMLVLAGPGAGKTRVVTHRVAYLLRVERVDPGAILVLCFNRSAIVSLRKKLQELVGPDMAAVTTLTFHGLALRLTGRSLAVTAGRGNNTGEIDFSRIITDAIALLKGESAALGFEGESARDTLIGRFSHILVDEYQDIDQEQYDLVSLLAGKGLDEQDQKMTILAVGDDDQNIYRFRGANVSFIRRFHEDYGAEKHYLIENYRSTANIIEAANQLIHHNRDRMKTSHPIQINQARRMLPRGGNRQITDPVTRGKVQVLKASGVQEQARGLVKELKRMQRIEGCVDLDSCAVLAREWKELDLVRALLETNNIPVNLHWGRGGGFPGLHQIRENALFLEFLSQRRHETLSGGDLIRQLPGRLAGKDTIWQANLRRLIEEWQEETNDTPQPVPLIEEYLYEAFSDQKRAKNLGNGVFLSTVHSVKGLEFDHVFLLAEHWPQLTQKEMEEERRLYYVAMTRTRETLQLFTLKGVDHPHVSLLSGDGCIFRELQEEGASTGPVSRRTLLGMEDLFLDYAGLRKEDSPVRRGLDELNAGDILYLTMCNDNLELVNTQGISVARLSKAALATWWQRVKDVEEVRIVAMVRRYRDNLADETFRNRCIGEVWEVPIVEVRHAPVSV